MWSKAVGFYYWPSTECYVINICQGRNYLYICNIQSLVKYFIEPPWCTWFSFIGLNHTRNFHFFPPTWVQCIIILGRTCWRWVYIAISYYFKSITKLTDTNYKRCERFVSVTWEFLQFSMSSRANSLPVHEALLWQKRALEGPKKLSFKFFLNFSPNGIDLYIIMVS